MPIINWSEELELGIEVIDSQHKKLVEIINELHDAMRAGRSGEKMDEIISRLLDYAVYHFNAEEKFMQETAYSFYDQHKNEHENFKKTFQQKLEDIKSGKLVFSVEIMTYLKNWLAYHITKTDRNYAPHFKKHNIN